MQEEENGHSLFLSEQREKVCVVEERGGGKGEKSDLSKGERNGLMLGRDFYCLVIPEIACFFFKEGIRRLTAQFRG